MNIKPATLVLGLLLAVSSPGNHVYAAEASKEDNQSKPAASGVDAELKDLVAQVQAKLGQGKKSEADLKDEINRFDEILAKHKGEKTDAVAKVLTFKAMLYFQILNDVPKAMALTEQLKRDFPDTEAGKSADEMLASMKQQEESKKIQKTLVGGAPFPDFDEKDLDGKPLSVARFKGKVVLVDFWATWCGPCVGELPNVLKTYEKHHGEGFEIIGISLDNNKEKLTDFLKTKKMTWPQYFDGKGWKNKLAGKYGITSIPATYLLNGEGKIIAKNLRGEDLEEAVAKAVAKK